MTEVVKSKNNNSTGNPVSKIIVSFEDELPFIIEDLQESPTDRVAISVPSGSDLLISSVGMRLIAEKADELDKQVIIVTDDQTGRNLANSAGLVASKSMDDLSENLWEEAEQNYIQRKKKSEVKEVEKVLDETEPSSGTENENKEEIQEPEKTIQDESRVNRDYQDDFEKIENNEIGFSSESEKSEEKMSLGWKNDSASKDRTQGSDLSSVRKVEVDGLEIEIDNSPAQTNSKPIGKIKSDKDTSPPPRKSLVGRDFSGYKVSGIKAESDFDKLPVKKDSDDASASKHTKNLKGKSSSGGGGFIATIFNKLKRSGISGFLSQIKSKGLWKYGVGALVVVAVIFAFLSWYLPDVIITIDVESIPVEYEGEVTARTDVEDVEKEDLLIPAKYEQQPNDGSGTAVATGVDYRGENATGNVTIYNKTDESITLPAGTTITGGGYSYSLDSSTTVPPKPDEIGMGSQVASVRATGVGEEYNLAGGTEFSVGSYSADQVTAINASAFTGGAKQEYTFVKQEDIDGLIEETKKDIFDDSEGELRRKHNDDRWVYVSQATKHKIDGETTTDVPAGAEAEAVNVSFDTLSESLYYDGEALDEMLEDLLMEDLDISSDIEGLVLSDDLEKEVNIKSTSVENGEIVLSVKVSGYVMPQVDKEKIERDMQGQSWGYAVRKLKELEYSAGDPELLFYPEWFPNFLRRMPSREGRITVDIDNIAPESKDDSEESEEDSSNEGNDGESDEE